MHHPICSLILDNVDQLGKKLLLTIKENQIFMKKKLLLGAMLGVSVMAFAKIQAVWTSTCGVTHYTTFADGTSHSLMVWYIQNINEDECGVKPNVNINP